MIPHIEHRDKFLSFIKRRGVGKRNPLSPNSYIAYLKGVSRGLKCRPITPDLVSSPDQIEKILRQVKDKPLLKTGRLPAENTIRRWRTALRAYLEMCEKHNLH